VTQAVLDELERCRADERPFFVFAHYFDPHYDYVAPPPYDRSFDPDYRGPIDSASFFDSPAVSLPDDSDPYRRRQVASARDMEFLRAQYAAELAWTDAQIGRILDRLDELGVADRTLVVVTADHGEEFFEHGNLGHRSTLHEELVQVPLILRLPGRLPAGRRVAGLVSTIDVVPTALELLGLPPLGGLASRSFVDLVEGREGGGERAVLGRLVRHSTDTMRVPKRDSPSGRVPAVLNTVLETYRRGPIKITRERSWPRPRASVSPKTAKALAAESERLRSEERLRWIDVERHPDEAEEAHSTDFTDPRALEALRAFRARYEELLARRGSVQLGDVEDHLPALQGLGYVGADDETADPSTDFALPPPGASLLPDEDG
jgi:hypothetical protein